MSWLWTWIACGLIRPGGGTAVGNPGLAVMRLAEGDGAWASATVDEATLVFERCDGWKHRVRLEAVDLVAGPTFEVPGGPMCGVRIELDGLAAAGLSVAGTATLTADGVRLDRSHWVFELGEPGAPEGLESRSGLYEELVADGQLDPLERAQGSAAEGVERGPDEPEPPVLVAVGAEGFRAAVTGPSFPAYLFDDEVLPLHSAAYGDGRWVVVGGDQGGLVGTSLDQGASWSLDTVPEAFSAVVAWEGTFYATTFGGGVQSSTDGLSWVPRAAEGETWRAMAAGPTEMVAVGDGAALWSEDGSTWEWEKLPGAPSLFAVAWGPPGFVAVGVDGERWYRGDGGPWLQKATGGGKLHTVAWSGERYVAIGDADTWFSTTGELWEKGPTSPFDAVIRHDDALVGTGGEGLERSTDHGETWRPWVALEAGFPWGLGTNRP